MFYFCGLHVCQCKCSQIVLSISFLRTQATVITHMCVYMYIYMHTKDCSCSFGLKMQLFLLTRNTDCETTVIRSQLIELQGRELLQ